MANSDRPSGLRPVRTASGSPYNGQCEKVFIPATDSTAVFLGDAVKLAGSADADGIPTVAQVAAGNAVYGVVVGFEPNRDDLSVTYRKASTAQYAYVCTDREMLYEIQDDASATLAATNVGNTADIVVGSGSTVSGLSGMELNASDADANAGTLLIKELVQREDNEIGDNAKWLVKIVEHQYDLATGV